MRIYTYTEYAVYSFNDASISESTGALIADGMGLGKTVTALILVTLTAALLISSGSALPFRGVDSHPKLALDDAFPPSPHFCPTLIVCPSSAFGTWKHEINKFFPQLNVQYYMGSPLKASMHERSHVLLIKASNLRAWVLSLDPSDPVTIKVIILIMYATWLIRTLLDTYTSGPNSKRWSNSED